MRFVLFALCLPLALTACVSSREPADGQPLYELKPHEVAEAEPRPEPILAAGNTSPYRVNGKTYRVLSSSKGYREQGLASWYGSKFHGRRTANGEVFNAYAASAAHRSLPIPTYVRVTNLDNGRSMTVRVNDRGPFHPDRIIDLSYAGAVRLGFDQQGTARVEVVALDVGDGPDLRSRGDAGTGLLGNTPYRYIQVGAFSEKARAEELSKRLRGEVQAPVAVSEILLGDEAYYRVRVGPVDQRDRLLDLHRQLKKMGYREVRLMPD